MGTPGIAGLAGNLIVSTGTFPESGLLRFGSAARPPHLPSVGTMLKSCRWTTLLFLLVTQAAIALRGPGHHAFDDDVDSAACSATSHEAASMRAADESCPLCDLLSSLATSTPDSTPPATPLPVEAPPPPPRSSRPIKPTPNIADPRAPPVLPV